MKPRLDVMDVISFVLIAASIALGALLYPTLPTTIPWKFDFGGHPIAWLPKATGVWLLPAIALGVWALLRLGPSILPLAWKERMQASPLSAAALATTALVALLDLLCLSGALHPESIASRMYVVLGVYFIVLGQLLPRIRRNPLIGIRTTWTLTSDENWLRTHRFGGYTMTLGGLAAIGLSFLSPPAAVAAILVGVLAPVIYSFLLARRLPA
jgi:uncharacterized membrane protein